MFAKIMPKTELFPFSLIFIILIFSNCRPTSSLEYSSTPQTLLWEISGNGLAKPSYWFGTMHLMCEQDIALSPQLKNIIEQADQVYYEIDIDNLSEHLSLLHNKETIQEYKLGDVLNKQEYEKLHNFFVKHNMENEFEWMQHLSPMFLAMMASKTALPCNAEEGMELAIQRVALKNQKPTKGLETATFQYTLFNQIPYQSQVNYLLRTIDSIQSESLKLTQLTQLYLQQDIQKLYEFAVQDTLEEGLNDVLLFKRNKNWVEQFNDIAKTNSTLFAVGAAHLGGEEGVLKLLQKKGYTVRPLKNKSFPK